VWDRIFRQLPNYFVDLSEKFGHELAILSLDHGSGLRESTKLDDKKLLRYGLRRKGTTNIAESARRSYNEAALANANAFCFFSILLTNFVSYLKGHSHERSGYC
jgi:hypothetical protein